jgi:hypothetical protein
MQNSTLGMKSEQRFLVCFAASLYVTSTRTDEGTARHGKSQEQ